MRAGDQPMVGSLVGLWCPLMVVGGYWSVFLQEEVREFNVTKVPIFCILMDDFSRKIDRFFCQLISGS